MRQTLVLGAVALTASAVFELMGIGLVFPIVQLLAADDLHSQHAFLRQAAALLSIETPVDLALAGIIAVFVLIVTKGVLSLIFEYWLSRRVLDGRHQAMLRLFDAYLGAPLEWHDNSNSATLLHRLNTCCNIAFNSSVLSLIGIISDTILAIGMTAILIYTSPLAAGLGLLAGIVGLKLNNMVLAPRIHAVSNHNHNLARELSILALEAIRGIRDVRLLSCESFLSKNYDQVLSGLTDAQANMRVYQVAPRYLFEIIAGAFILIVFLILVADLDKTVIVPTMALYAVTAMRLLPAVARAASQINQLRGLVPAAMELKTETETLGRNLFLESANWTARNGNRRKNSMRRNLSLDHVSFRYGEGVPVLNDVSITIERGQSVAIVGASGAGKSTLINLLLGLYQPSQGALMIDGEKLDPNLSAYARNISLVPQQIFLADTSIRRNVAFGLADGEIDDIQVRRALADAKLLDFVSSLPDGLDTLVGEQGVRLSGGQRQRIGIARALYTDPEIIVLDEATSSLDLETEAQISEVVAALHGKKTLITVAHRLSTIQNCDCIYFLKDGRVIDQGTFDELHANNAEFHALVKLGQLQTADQAPA
ncbi:MAG: ABC transporter ATP-binding protein [Rhodospirillales bacterium]